MFELFILSYGSSVRITLFPCSMFCWSGNPVTFSLPCLVSGMYRCCRCYMFRSFMFSTPVFDKNEWWGYENLLNFCPKFESLFHSLLVGNRHFDNRIASLLLYSLSRYNMVKYDNLIKLYAWRFTHQSWRGGSSYTPNTVIYW